MFVDMLEKFDARFNESKSGSDKGAVETGAIDMFQELDNDISASVLRQFFKRSNSLLYPGITMAPSHHPFEHKCSDSLALAERPHMLNPEVGKEQLFGLPVQQKTTKEHNKIAKDHGVKYLAHQSLAAPWSSFRELLQPSTSKAEKLEPMEVSTGTIRPNVIVHSNSVNVNSEPSGNQRRRASASVATPPPRGFAPIKLDNILNALHQNHRSCLQISLTRWKHTLSLMAKAYHELLLSGCGGEASCSVLLSEMAGFPIRESQFRKRMEKFKAAQTKDLVFEVERGKPELIAQTIRQLNVHYSRRTVPTSSPSQNNGNESNVSVFREAANTARDARLAGVSSFWGSSMQDENGAISSNPPLACHKVKVTFKDEPGEGTGVARSFFTAVADAFLTMQNLPGEQQVLSAFGSSSTSSNTTETSARTSGRSASRDRGLGFAADSSFARQALARERRSLRRYSLSPNSIPYYSQQNPQLNEIPDPPRNDVDQQSNEFRPPLWVPERMILGERLLLKVNEIRPRWRNKIAGMLLELHPQQLITILSNDEILRSLVEEANELLLASGYGHAETATGGGFERTDALEAVPSMGRTVSTPNLQGNSSQVSNGDDDLAPLFYQTCKSGYYSPIAGKNSAHRLNAFRNVGRMIGICLLQMEIFPFPVCRHVLKFVLGRPINWYDLAFYDPALFESLRSLVYNEGPVRADQIKELFLTFEVNLPGEEGGGVIELKAGGSRIAVTQENIVEYIYRFVEARMLGIHLKCLEAMKQGVFDVIPVGSLANLSAEDLRLLLCGTQEISMALMQSYTSFLDESSAAPALLQKFKTWFWSICGKLTSQEKQDLMFFWTGSPSLPASEEGFQPMPTVLVRPADDQHLPTANTCISRLYVPLYSSKKILKSKLLMAIKEAQNFGFV